MNYNFPDKDIIDTIDDQMSYVDDAIDNLKRLGNFFQIVQQLQLFKKCLEEQKNTGKIILKNLFNFRGKLFQKIYQNQEIQILQYYQRNITLKECDFIKKIVKNKAIIDILCVCQKGAYDKFINLGNILSENKTYININYDYEAKTQKKYDIISISIWDYDQAQNITQNFEQYLKNILQFQKQDQIYVYMSMGISFIFIFLDYLNEGLVDIQIFHTNYFICSCFMKIHDIKKFIKHKRRYVNVPIQFQNQIDLISSGLGKMIQYHTNNKDKTQKRIFEKNQKQFVMDLWINKNVFSIKNMSNTAIALHNTLLKQYFHNIKNILWTQNNVFTFSDQYRYGGKIDIQKDHENLLNQFNARLKYSFMKYDPSVQKKSSNFHGSLFINQIREKIKNSSVSQAFFKMVQICTDLKLLHNKKEVQSIHFCEMPGNFIQALNFLCQKNGIRHYWHAQSYFEKKKNGKTRFFGDDHGIFEKGHKKGMIDYGIDGTGDITNKDNIKYYAKKYYYKKFITFDCGVDKECSQYLQKLMRRILQFIILMQQQQIQHKIYDVVYIFKQYNPVDYKCAHLFHQIYSMSDSFSIFKPYKNTGSREFYIVINGLNKKIKNDSDLLMKWFYQVQTYLIDKMFKNVREQNLRLLLQLCKEQYSELIQQLYHQYDKDIQENIQIYIGDNFEFQLQYDIKPDNIVS